MRKFLPSLIRYTFIPSAQGGFIGGKMEPTGCKTSLDRGRDWQSSWSHCVKRRKYYSVTRSFVINFCVLSSMAGGDKRGPRTLTSLRILSRTFLNLVHRKYPPKKTGESIISSACTNLHRLGLSGAKWVMLSKCFSFFCTYTLLTACNKGTRSLQGEEKDTVAWRPQSHVVQKWRIWPARRVQRVPSGWNTYESKS